MVRIVEQVGLQLPRENEGTAPAGRPETEKETGCVVPEVRVVVTVLDPWDP